MRRAALSVIGALVLILFILASGSTFLTDRLWFMSMGQAEVFWTGFLTNWGVRLFSFGFPFLFLLGNLALAARALRRPRPAEETLLFLEGLPLTWIVLLVAAVLSFFVATAFKPSWTAVQAFLHAVKVGEADPVLGLDLGYYLFRYPIWQGMNGLLQSLLWLSLLAVGLVYWAARAFWRQGTRYLLWPQAKLHLTVLAALLLLGKIWGYALARQGLLLAEGGLLTGVDYTAATVRLPVYQILSWITAGCLVLLIIGLFRRGVRFLAFGLGLLLVASFFLGTLYPAFVKAMVVKPNEFRLEEPYLARHIAATRRAFGLDRFHVRDYPFKPEKPTADDPTLANLRLWDFRPLKLSYDQLQTIRPYYTFHDIDIDRYRIGGQKRQVMLAARELDPTELPANARNWVNLHLSYTHGYGLAMNATGEVNPEGQPVFLIGNIPPVIAEGSGLPRIERPQIYFGETQSGYLIVPNGYQEFDHPTAGGEHAVTTYRGRDGVPIHSFWRKLLFAFRFGEPKFLLSRYLTPESRVLLYRRIDERVRRLAPFLTYDPDPYLVLADGRLYWLLDAYTQSSTYPYAARHPGTGVNYLRNPVKVVVDAYEGTVRFYVLDEEEPILRVWRRVFPRLFLPLAAMPESLKEHLRYPEHLFRVQRDMLLTYHMTDPLTFFRKEDAWAVPTETTTGTEEEMIPYYVLLRLPGEKEAEFVLMQPLKPISEKRRNMTAWMAARCDGEHYGEVVVYRLPKDRVFYGPLQVEGRIAQEPEISKLLTLWGQQQSSVVRGNLLVLPFGGDFLYVEPIYIVSSQGQQPELKLIVLVYRDRIIYGSAPAEVLGRLLGTVAPSAALPPSTGKKLDEERLRALLRSFEERMGQAIKEFVTELENELGL